MFAHFITQSSQRIPAEVIIIEGRLKENGAIQTQLVGNNVGTESKSGRISKNFSILFDDKISFFVKEGITDAQFHVRFRAFLAT